VWRALRNIDPAKEKDGGNPWLEEIHRFPVEVPKVDSVVVVGESRRPRNSKTLECRRVAVA
jgi:3-ketoacyl-CoA synthase